jgi:hypothetical protein
MSLAVLELNDQALLIKNQDGEVFSEPGFALHTGEGIITGIEARKQAWLQPQNVYRQYWRNLNQTELSGDFPWARHHADIAFAQLKTLLNSAGSPEQLVISVAACFDDEQLSLLLGLLSAIPVKIIGVVDSSLADCMYIAGQVHGPKEEEKTTLHIDLHLFQSIASQITFSEDSVQITAQRVLPELGAMDIYSLLAKHIRDKLVKNFRFDPMDAPQGEQAIYDLLPDWVIRFESQSEYGMVIPSPRGDLPVMLYKSEVLELLSSRLNKLTSMLRQFADNDVSFSKNARMISILTDEFHASRHLKAHQGVDSCFKFAKDLLADDSVAESDNLHRITSIQQLEDKFAKPQLEIRPPGTATHLLYQGQAWPLQQPLSITIEGDRVQLLERHDDSATAVLIIEGEKVVALHKTPKATVELPHIALCGMELFINAYKFELIEVCNG